MLLRRFLSTYSVAIFLLWPWVTALTPNTCRPSGLQPLKLFTPALCFKWRVHLTLAPGLYTSPVICVAMTALKETKTSSDVEKGCIRELRLKHPLLVPCKSSVRFIQVGLSLRFSCRLQLYRKPVLCQHSSYISNINTSQGKINREH